MLLSVEVLWIGLFLWKSVSVDGVQISDDLIRLNLTYPSKDTLHLKKMAKLYHEIKKNLLEGSHEVALEKLKLFEKELSCLSRNSFIDDETLSSYKSFIDTIIFRLS